ncbi:MAG: hypothetical protein A2Y34_02905 [Spirochaetes bacterium GWC1_27_15]|nr:MAG: hypothetical protein A2Z98_05790 [Spirochaetes bacterium GWB1_27_13]OHD28026.1 MAG: hypothetical protein A2Y34_02905 [Spirochaetes bacterium GWC1_27_15]
MVAEQKKLLHFLEGHDKTFLIPVYQRNYDWKKEQCRQLYNDFVDIIKNKYNSHFFGSIVYLYNDDGNGQEFIVIDGQQRITTVSILLLAIINLIKSKEVTCDFNSDVIFEYLLGKYSEKEKIKLRPIKNDNEAFKKLFNISDDKIKDSNITNNYYYFIERIKKNEISIDELFSAIKKLVIVDIKLKKDEDDPQLIFESLNSTGLDLTEADKVRNFILMSQNSKLQEKYYKDYWNKIEKLTNNKLDDFLRDYLTYKERKIPNKDKIYISFKEYVNNNNLKNNFDIFLNELLKYAKYYEKIINCNTSNNDINNLFKILNKLEVTVSFPFLLEVLNDFEEEKIISEKNFIEILKVLEIFIFRRIICDVPTNALNKIFMTIGRDIKKFEDYKEKYTEIFKYILLQKNGSQRFPDNLEFSEKIIIKDIYNMNTKNKIHLLESLENFNNKEKINLQLLLDERKLSIEHIMPKKITKQWQVMLGENYTNIHEKYLNTLGNISFTAYNSEMSNRPFKEKKEMEGGFNQSKLFLNQYLKTIENWNEEVLLKRANLLKEKSLEIWAFPKYDYINKKDLENTYSLDDEYDFTGEKIKSFQFRGQEFIIDSWKEFYHQINLLLYDLSPSNFKQFLNDEDFKKKRILISNNGNLKVPLKISDDLYLEANLSAEAIISMTIMILKKLNIEVNEINICLKEIFDN